MRLHICLYFPIFQMMHVFEIQAESWQLIKDEEEMQILIRYSERSRIVTNIYISKALNVKNSKENKSNLILKINFYVPIDEKTQKSLS